jgi:hypothetical protein
MPVELDDDGEERSALHPTPSRAVPENVAFADTPGTAAALVERTVAPIITASLRAIDAPTALSVNRAAALALAVAHRWELVQHRSNTPPAASAPLSPEETLLRAIFGEKASGLNVAELDDDGLPSVGARFERNAVVLGDPLTREKVRFEQDAFCTVLEVLRESEGLPEGVDVRVTLRLGAESPLLAGDILECAATGARLGAVRSIVEDDSDEAIVWLGADERARAGGAVLSVRRALATARQMATGRAYGPRDPRTREPLSGEVLFSAQREALFSRGCFALFNELGAYKCDDATASSLLVEDLLRGQQPRDPWEDVELEPPSAPTAAPKDIFAFFDAPKSRARPARARLERAIAYARALGVALSVERRSLSLARHGDPIVESCGALQEDLGDERVFGPRKDYECRCGALRRMKNRGEVCATCGVEVLSSSVRRTRFGHIELRSPLVHPLLGEPVRSVAVLGPGLRESLDPELELAYAALLEERSTAAFSALCDALLRRLLDALVDDRGERVDFSAGATAVVDSSLALDALVAPYEVLRTIAMPMLQSKFEELGVATTIKGAREAIERDEPKARAVLAWVLSIRPLLLHGAAEGRSIAAAFVTGLEPEPAFRLGTAIAAKLGITSGDRLSAHLPLTAGALREARWLVHVPESDRLRRAPSSDEPQWIDRLLSASSAERTLSFGSSAAAIGASIAAWSAEGASDSGTSSWSAWLLGGYPCEDDAGLEDEEPPPLSLPEARADSPGEGSLAAHPWLDRPIDELELSVRTMNALQNMGISTVRELVSKTEADLLKTKGVSRKTLIELKVILQDGGLSLGLRLND